MMAEPAVEGGQGTSVPSMILLATAVLLRSLAAVFAKQAALTSIGAGFAGMVINPWLLAELVALGVEAVAWTLTLRRMPLSVAYPFMSLAFGLNLTAAWLVFGEVVTAKHWTGVTIIVIGVTVGGWRNGRRG